MRRRRPGWLAAIGERMSHLFRRQQTRRDLDEEMQFHLQQLTRKLLAQGLDPLQARREAERRFGAVESIKEQVDDFSGVRPLLDFVADARFAARLLRRKPGYALLAVATLSIGIGATTALFTVAHAVLIRPLPVSEPEQLYALWGTADGKDTAFGMASLPDIEDWRVSADSWEQIAGYAGVEVELGGADEPDLVVVGRVTSHYFELMRMTPTLGRLPSPPDFGAESSVAVMSASTWRRRFGAARDVVGRTVRLGDTSYQVVAVADPGPLSLPESAEFWIAFTQDTHRGSRSLNAVARLRLDVSRQVAEQDLAEATARIAEAYPDSNAGRSVRAVPLQESLVGSSGSRLQLFLAAAVLVFLIACVNTANLLYVGSAERMGELAVRQALGAGRRRLVRHVFAEAAVLAGLGAVGGMIVSWISIQILASQVGTELPRLTEIGIGAPSVLAAATLALVGAVAVGLAPGLQAATSSEATATLARAAGRAAVRRRSGESMIVMQVALTFVLVFGAALLLRSLWLMGRVDPGVDPAGVATFRLTLPASRYAGLAEIMGLHADLTTRLSALPGISAVSAANVLPYAPGSLGDTFATDGARPDEQSPHGELRSVMGDYFVATGIDMVSGRHFNASDRDESAPVAIVNRALARLAWPDEDPVGHTVYIFESDRQVVGVAEDVHGFGLDRPVVPTVYVPFLQGPARSVSYAVRGAGDPTSVLALARAIVRDLDPDLPFQDPLPLAAHLQRTTAPYRHRAWLLAGMGAMALLLAVIGVYGLTAQVIRGRRDEIGIRMALGATRWSVLQLVVQWGFVRIVLGAALGLGIALLSSRTFQGIVYGITPTDPLTALASLATLVAAGLAGAWAPALRASRVDPAVTLRAE